MEIQDDELAKLINEYKTTSSPDIKDAIVQKLTEMFGMADGESLKKALAILNN